MRARIVLGIVIASMLIPVLVQAHHVDPRDPNDTRGLLDIKRVDVAFTRQPRFQVITWRRWTAKQIWDKGFGLVWLDTFGKGRYDYYALVRSNGSGLVGEMFRDRQGRRDRRLFFVRAWKASRNSFSVRLRLSRLRMPASRRVYRWKVQTLFVGSRCRRTCFDFVPNQRAIREPNPFAPKPPPTTTTILPTTTTTASTVTASTVTTIPTSTIPTSTIPTTTTISPTTTP
jgi:hypothetical protein